MFLEYPFACHNEMKNKHTRDAEGYGYFLHNLLATSIQINITPPCKCLSFKANTFIFHDPII